jgi:hypothetical protein
MSCIEDICPACRKRAFVGGIELDHDGSRAMIWVSFFCDRTGACEASMARRTEPWVQSEYLERVGR